MVSISAEWPKGKRPLLALIGEAPGTEEVEGRRPFIGPAGRVLDRILRVANIERGECFIGNIFDTKLENNDVGQEKAKRGLEWSEFERAQIARLGRELNAAMPHLIVALGDTAVRYLTAANWTVGSVRGTVRPGAGVFAGRDVFTTYHPAFVMRQWKFFVTAVQDLVKAKGIARGGGLGKVERRLNVEPNISEVEAFLGGPCRETDLLSVDIETAHKVGIIKGIAFAPSQYEAMYVPFVASWPNASYWTSPELEARAWAAVKQCLESDVPKLGQNFGNYDLPWLFEKANIFVKGFQEDLMLMHKVLFPELPAGLEFMAGCYSEQGPWKSSLRKSHDGKMEE